MTSAEPPNSRALLLLSLLAIIVAALAVSSQSFWIDEMETALKAMAPTPNAWWQALYGEHNSNLQLLFYMFYVWGWARLFGVSEVSMRAANIPFFFLGFFAILYSVRRHPALRNTLLLVFCLHPFVWYYLDEARPYMVQLSGALLAAGGLFAAFERPDESLSSSWWWLFCAGLIILCGSGILGVPWAAAIMLLLVAGRRGFLQSMLRAGLPALLVTAPILLGLGLYFAWTLKVGARPGETEMRVSSIPFVFYEQLGFVGLGPGRAEMRSGGLGIFLSWAPCLGLLGVPLIYALARAGAERFGLDPGKLMAICVAVFFPTAFVIFLGFAKNFLVLGRHITPLFPFVLGATGFGIAFLWSRERFLDRAVAVWLLAALTVSALECRFAYRHKRDDNKDAVAVAKAALAHGEDVWWVADGETARFYQLPVSEAAEPGMAQLLWKKGADELADKKAPEMIVLCKPDLFDPYSGVREFIARHGYEQTGSLPAFSIWTK